MHDQNQPPIYTLDQAAARVQLSPKSLRRAIASGRLTCSRPTGKDIRITAAQLDQWLESTTTSGGRP